MSVRSKLHDSTFVHGTLLDHLDCFPMLFEDRLSASLGSASLATISSSDLPGEIPDDLLDELRVLFALDHLH